jgi:hypothetical protein
MKHQSISVDEFKAQAKPRRFGRGIRPDNSVMNKTEAAYAKYLEERKMAGEIWGWKFHAFTLTIAQPPHAKCARWQPDFAVWTKDMVLEFHEVKGFMQDHAIVRIKAAASQYPHPIYVAKKSKVGWLITPM